MSGSTMSRSAAEDLLAQSLQEIASAARQQGLSDTMIANQFLSEAVCQAYAVKEQEAEGALWVSDMIESFDDFLKATTNKVAELLDAQNKQGEKKKT